MKTRFIKLLALILSVITFLTALSACSADFYDGMGDNNNVTPSTDYGNGSENITDSSDKESDEIKESTNTTDKTQDDEKSDDKTDDEKPADSSIKDEDGKLTVYKDGSYNVKFVCAADVKDFNKSFYTNLRSLFAKKIGKTAPSSTDATIYESPAILIGETAYEESKTVYKSLKANQAKAQILGNKYVIAYSSEDAALKLFENLRTLFSQKATDSLLVLDSSWNITLNVQNSTTEDTSNKIMACDQLNGRIVIYDLNKYSQTSSLDEMEVKSFKVGNAGDVKYRIGTVFGDVLLVSGGNANVTGIYNYSTGKAIWTTSNPGQSPHAIEILPSGNVVTASTSDNKIRLFKTSALKSDSSASVGYTDYTLEDAHGVLWDPTYKLLWVLGRYELKAFAITGVGTGEKLVEATNMCISLPEGKRGGHDLSPDYTDTRYLYITVGEYALKIDKQEHQIITNFEYSNIMTARNIKGFSNNPLGNFFITGPLGGAGRSWDNAWFESWCTDTIYFCRYNGSTYEKITLTTSKSAFYKARAFCGTYQ